MAQGNSIRIEGINALIASIERMVGKITDRRVMDEIGMYVTQAILQRTAAGVDAEGRPFEPYSPKYKFFREKKGRRTDIVNLKFFGSMLSALTHTAYDDRVEIFFMPTYGKTPYGKASTISNAAKAYFLNEQREFFALSPDDEFEILQIIQEHLRKLFEG